MRENKDFSRRSWKWVAVFVAIMTGCGAPSPQWNGSWRLNPSKGNFEGPVFTISISPAGEYRYDDGNSSSSIVCDGKDKPAKSGGTHSCTRVSATRVEIVAKTNGLETGTGHWELSPDGKTFTMTATEPSASGPIVMNRVVSSRISGTDSFEGKWRDMSYLEKHAELTLKLDERTLQIGYPNAGQWVNAPLDGTDAPVQGPHAPKGLSFSVRAGGSRLFSIINTRNGKTILNERLELSADGATVTDLWWGTEKSSGTGKLVYERQ
jgi:hypothetical protein